MEGRNQRASDFERVSPLQVLGFKGPPLEHFNDKITKVIYNASGYEKETDAKIRDFLRFVYTNDPSEDVFSVRLTKRVENLKQSERFREAYATMNLWEMDIRREERKEALAEGRALGAEERSVENAVIAVREFNIDPQLAAEKMKAPLEKVMEKLKQK
ncbi:MAG TPA: hypothetical protein DCZ76_01055 [Treponema sp.]|nr:hypothetical protein [Treponema sp.]